VLNYFGQGALVLTEPGAVENPFYQLAPEWAHYPMIALATAAAVIASQAIISGAFSLTQQAVQLGLLPRFRIMRTSETLAGQIFVPQVNTMLMVGVVALLLFLRTSSNLSAAYGIAVTGAMFVDTLLFFVIIRYLWKRPLWQAILAVAVFGSLDLVFLGSNLLKIPQGAWVPLALGGSLIVVMWTWQKGTRLLTERYRTEAIQFDDLVASLAIKPPHRTEGTAVFFTADPKVAPVALLHNLKHNRVLHMQNILLTVKTTDAPRVPESERVAIEEVSPDFKRLTINYGFMEAPNLPSALAACRVAGLKLEIMTTSFFFSRKTLIASPTFGMPLWQDAIFIFLMRNAGSPADFFRLPAGRVIEMGEQVIV
jgi:KUP system potassium uptake protein